MHRFGAKPIERDMIDLLILNNQNRGLEAAGIAIQQADGSVAILKQDVTAYQFLASREYQRFMEEYLRPDSVTVLGHTRKATKGNPKVIANNHPMFAGETALVHNGHISNDDWAFGEWKLPRKAETDSDILRAILDKEGFSRGAINKMSRLSGNAAFAAVSPKYPGKLLLGRSGNPIELAATADWLMFSSERGPLYKALRPMRQVYGITMREMSPIDYYMIGMTDNSAWLFGEQPQDGNADWTGSWVEWTQEMRIAVNWTPATYLCHQQYHGNRVKFYDDRPVDVVKCPNPLCGLYISVNAAMLKDLPRYKCATCKTKLG